MKVYVFPADEAGCGYYRLIWPAEELKRRGYDVEIIIPKDRKDSIRAEFDTNTGTPIRVMYPDDADVLVFQRITHTFLARCIPLMREQGAAVVVDVDDDLSRIDPSNPAFESMHPRHVKAGKSEHSWKACEDACRHATMVQVSTPALLRRYAPHDRGQVIRNCVPQSFLEVEHEDSDVVGYGGALHSHSSDVPMLGNSIARLQAQGVDFMTIGQANGIMRILGLPREPIAHGYVSLQDWPHFLTKIGIGVAPLAATQFNRAKSWLKMLEMAAVGVPCVGSPSDEYKEINKLGVGLLAERPKDWYRVLRRLASDPVERRDLAAAGREVVSQLTIEKNADLWWQLWERAYSLEQAGLPIEPTRSS